MENIPSLMDILFLARNLYIIPTIDNAHAARLLDFLDICIKLPEYRQNDMVFHLYGSFKAHSRFPAPFLRSDFLFLCSAFSPLFFPPW